MLGLLKVEVIGPRGALGLLVIRSLSAAKK